MLTFKESRHYLNGFHFTMITLLKRLISVRDFTGTLRDVHKIDIDMKSNLGVENNRIFIPME